MVFFSSRISPFTSTVILRLRSPRATAVVTSAMLRTWPVRLLAIELTLSVRSFQVPATPRTCGLAAELAFGADFARHAADFGGEAVELIDHGVERVLQLENFALHVDGDLFRKVAVGHRGGHVGDVADLAGEVRGHRVDVVGEVLPGAGHAGHLRLAAELAFGADFAGHAADFAGEAVELIDHRVDRVLQLQNLAAHVDGDLLGQVAVGDRGRDVGDVADLRGEVGRHRVDRVGEILPGAGHAAHLGLAAEFAFGADLAGHARHFRGEAVELVDHRVDGVLQLEDFALHVDGDLLGKIAVGHRRGDLGDVADLAGEVGGHEVHVVGEVLPRAGHAAHLRPGRRACLRCRPRAPRASLPRRSR